MAARGAHEGLWLEQAEASPNQVLTHAARAAAEQLNSATSGGRARRARRALVRAKPRPVFNLQSTDLGIVMIKYDVKNFCLFEI